MLHNEARKLLVEGYEATHNAEAIAKIFHVNKYTVYHLEERKRKTGSVDLQTWRRGRKVLLSSTDKARIAECITKNPTINLEELRTQLMLTFSPNCVRSSPKLIVEFFVMHSAIRALSALLSRTFRPRRHVCRSTLPVFRFRSSK